MPRQYPPGLGWFQTALILIVAKLPDICITGNE